MASHSSLSLLWLSGFIIVGGAAEQCSWCEAGACNLKCDRVLDKFETTLTPLMGGHVMPYWRSSAMPSLGAAENNAKNIELAVIVHHGSARNADEYFCYMQNGVAAAGIADTTLVLAPQIFEAGDKGLDESVHIWWDAAHDDDGSHNWKWGGNSTRKLGASISSFETLDEMVSTLLRKSLYPNLKKIIFAGHSAGGQIIQRYALFNRIDRPGMNIPFEYYPANPSSVTYLDKRRPVLEPHTRTCDTRCVNTSILTQRWTFAEPSVECSSTYDSYGYGLSGKLPDYPTKTTPSVAIKQYAERKVVYLSGESDVCDTKYMKAHHCTSCTPDDGGLDGSCEAMTQGWCRMARFHAFFQYVQEFYNSTKVHGLISVPGVGHSGCGMFQSAEFAAAALNPSLSVVV